MQASGAQGCPSKKQRTRRASESEKDMTTAKSKASDEAQIRMLIENRVKAVHAKDVNGAMESITPDILLFDVVNPLSHRGSDAERKRAQEWFSSLQGPIGYEIRDLFIATGDDVAFSHCLNRYSGTTTKGGKLGMWVRVTTCYRKIDGKWMITHEHQSVPFDVETGKASLDLEP
ncbi:MAG TPA: nuclear transport factor 2 family protein [Ktedonobacteraceae bacterium]|nr:nuclear transport factor 2 family protein [Ktedonobacteraceae bacterium]